MRAIFAGAALAFVIVVLVFLVLDFFRKKE